MFFLLLIGVIASCTGSRGGTEAGFSRSATTPDLQSLVVPEIPPRIVANTGTEIARARRAVERLDRAALARQQGTRRSAAAGLGYLAASPVGKAFLEHRQHRALARGAPPAQCSATGVAGAQSTPARAAGAALGTCLSRLPEGSEGCGCRLLALDDIVLVPETDLAYAVGIAAHLRVPDLGIEHVLVAEQADARKTVLFDLKGRVGQVTRLGEGRVRVTLEGLAPFEGQVGARGFSRGRRAERVSARDGAGRRLSLRLGPPAAGGPS